jgi:hypothetical protein
MSSGERHHGHDHHKRRHKHRRWSRRTRRLVLQIAFVAGISLIVIAAIWATDRLTHGRGGDVTLKTPAGHR